MIWKLIAWVVSRPKVANWLIDRALATPYLHIIGAKGDVYMGRWWLFNPYPALEENRKNWFPISIRVHYIRRPDDDRHLHDHPWNARTIILKGGYTEVQQTGGVVQRDVGYTGSLKFGQYHRISDVKSGCWTLFITGKYRGTWGFLVNGSKVPHREYLKEARP